MRRNPEKDSPFSRLRTDVAVGFKYWHVWNTDLGILPTSQETDNWTTRAFSDARQSGKMENVLSMAYGAPIDSKSISEYVSDPHLGVPLSKKALYGSKPYVVDDSYKTIFEANKILELGKKRKRNVKKPQPK